MVSLGEVLPGLVTRLATDTAALRALREARQRGGDARALHGPVWRALQAARRQVRAAKERESVEVTFELAVRLLARAGWLPKATLRVLTRALSLLVAKRTPPPERRLLPSPWVAIDSSVPLPPAAAAFGRFGVLAPKLAVWVHHDLGEDQLAFVLQLGPDAVERAPRLRDAIARGVDDVIAAMTAAPEPAPEDVLPPPSPPRRLAFRRLLGLMAALAARPPSPPAKSSSGPATP
jgi:hypothetical protein